MPKVRAYGADSTLKACRETTYGVAPLSDYRSLDFKSCDLSAEQPLGDDPLLGRGRNAQDPYRGLIADEGNVDIPLDVRGTGWWLTGLFGVPTTGAAVKATGSIAFSAQPGANSTITLNDVTWTLVSGSPTGNQTQIGVSLDATLTALAADLNASADVEIAKCTYTADTANDQLDIEFDTAGATGNAWTLAASAASNGTPSAAKLTGGGVPHVWESGSDSIPSHTLEIGHPKLVTPVFFRHTGVIFESLNFEMGLEGPANGRVALVAQGETSYATTIDDTPDRYTLQRFTQGRGTIKKAGAQLAGVTAGTLTFSNTLERVRTIRPDGKIDAADPTIATCTGQMTVRFDGTTLVAEASSGDPINIEYGFLTPQGYALKFELFRVFLPQPKRSIAGPGGVSAQYDWRGAYEEGEDTMLRVTMLNDVASYA